ncbi:hypothetical protein AX15_000597 [Amanita polypyramis BW_CC]|nr:hypothetical protein AX15_000597 [Amanita polypyramis BW_CC]
MEQNRKTHRNRYSITHLSSETTATLPEYAAASMAWQQQPHYRHAHIQQQKTARALDPESEGLPYDRPPDYPDSADEADEETDSVLGDGVLYGGSTISLPHVPTVSLPTTPSPRRHAKRYSSSISPPSRHLDNYRHHYAHPPRNQPQQSHRPYHRRYKPGVALPSPTDDPYLDSLLERSVHALEMSNTLLQTSISTQSSLSTLLKTPVSEASDSKPFKEGDVVDLLEERTKGLTKKISVHEEKREQWVGDLEKIKRDMERLFGEVDERGNASEDEDVRKDAAGSSSERGRQTRRRNEIDVDVEPNKKVELTIIGQNGVSSSLPTSSSILAKRTCKRWPSHLDLRPDINDDDGPRLIYSPQYRSRLIAPAPRAITQYIVASSTEPEFITLPSTLGTRTPSSFLQQSSASASTVSLHASPLMPQITDKLPEPTTPAYNMLASFVHRTATMSSSTPSSVSSPSVLASFMPKTRRRASSSAAAISGSEAAEGSSSNSRSLIDDPWPERLQTTLPDGLSRGRTPRRGMSPLTHRPMTPPTEESTGSSSSESLIAKQTVMSLRKILDDQAARSEPALSVNSCVHRPLRAPAFLPVTPAPAALASTSNATASISRLFTKATHTSSTRPPSPPKHSALKHGSGSRNSTTAARQTSGGAEATSTLAVKGSSNSTSTSQTETSGTTSASLSVDVAKAHLSTLPELVNAGVARAFGARQNNTSSSPSSGQSTPKRISFAELPGPSRPEGKQSKFKEKQAQRRRRKLSGRGRRSLTLLSSDSGREGRNDDNVESGRGELAAEWETGSSPIGGGWWPGWLGGGIGDALSGMGGGSGGMYVSRYEERMEDRLNRSWGGLGRMATAPAYGGGLDGWTV